MSNRNGGSMTSPNAWRWGRDGHRKNGNDGIGGRSNSSRRRKHGGIPTRQRKR